MSKIKITLADAKAELRDVATGPGSKHWSYSPAVMALLNSHDELLSILGEATEALEEKDRQVKELLAARESQSVPVAVLDIQRNREDKPRLLMEYGSALDLPDDTYLLFTAPPAPAVTDERAEFEAFIERHFGESVDRRRAKNGDNEYMAWDMAMAWTVWQRRAAMGG